VTATRTREEVRQRARERAVEQAPATAPEGPFRVHVVGVSFVGEPVPYPENLRRVEAAWEARELLAQTVGAPDGEGIPAVLMRNPANRVDANAVEVHVPSVGSMIGHLPRALAQRIAPALDAGQLYEATIYDVRTDPDHPERPGVHVVVRRVAAAAARR
jgi:hypothetical protein